MRIPRLRNWFHGSAVLGAFGTAYWVFLGIIGIAPMIQADLKWWLLGIGATLSVATWYALAVAHQSAEEAEEQARRRHEDVKKHTTTETDRATAESNAHTTAELNRITTEVRAAVAAGFAAQRSVKDVTHHEIRAPLIQAIQDVVVETETGGLTITGHAPDVFVTASPALSQWEVPTASATTLLTEISETPPTTEEEVRVVVEKLREYAEAQRIALSTAVFFAMSGKLTLKEPSVTRREEPSKTEGEA